MSKSILLQGEPGCGKSMMGALTAINKPVHIVDIDRKVGSAAWAQEAIKKQELTYWELKEPIDDSNIKARNYSLVTNAKPNVQPMGWTRLADYVYEMPKSEDAKRAGASATSKRGRARPARRTLGHSATTRGSS